jgi:hypothetical protein
LATYDETKVANMALSHCGIGQEISALSENSAPARACNFWYDIARDLALASFPWPFANKQVTLALVEEDPNDEWQYSYRYPSNCIVFRRIVSGVLPESKEIPFKLGHDVTGILIFCNQTDAIGEITATFGTEGLWPDAFASAVSWLLAERIAPKLQVDRSRQLDATGYMDKALMQAKGIQSQEQANQPRPPASSVIARHGIRYYGNRQQDWQSFPDPIGP